MVDLKCLVILVLTLINFTRCELNHNIHKRVSEINNRSREMYGEVRRGRFKKDFVLEKLMYPRGNKRKLSAISQTWRDYYACLAAQLDVLNEHYLSQNNIIYMVFQGMTAHVPCMLCQEPGEMDNFTWLYSNTAGIADTGNFKVLQDFDRVSIKHGVMTIYNIMPADQGAFWCTRGAGGGGLTFVEVVDKEPYTVVKPPESRGAHAIPTEIYQNIILFSQWSVWSECSVCGKVGRRHRYGMCYVKLEQDLITRYVLDSVKTANHYKLFELDDKLIELFQIFPKGLPCRSQYMPQIMKDLDIIQQRSSEIMIGLCKVPCEDTRRKKDKATQGSDQNGTRTYPITSELPKQPPLPSRDIIFADFGQRVVIRCPGTTLRDVPITWRVGTKTLVPRNVDKGSGGRVYLNCRDHLVFTETLYTDDNAYSCWQRENLAGTVKLVVWPGAQLRWRRHATLSGAALAAALALCLLLRAAHTLQRHMY